MTGSFRNPASVRRLSSASFRYQRHNTSKLKQFSGFEMFYKTKNFALTFFDSIQTETIFYTAISDSTRN